LGVLAFSFVLLAAGFLCDLWGHSQPPAPIPLVDPVFLDTSTVRESYAELARKQGDLSGFDCYACHEKNKAVPLHYDANHKLIMPKEHEDIVMGHGRHDRNNNCYNCHDETNLERLQTRDGRELKFADSPSLCGSCHGPTYRDWEGGVHGRTSGSWNRALGEFKRQDCVDCHDPHSPKFPSRKPAPAPHALRELAKPKSPSHN
jgi:uncharacterized CHY-type Zn-finger protein